MKDYGLRIYQGATAVVTGAASGIGRALSEELARRGTEVFLADLQEEQLEEVAAGIRAAGGKASACNLDVAYYAPVEAFVQQAYRSTGRLDFIFNNAGITVAGRPEVLSLQDWRCIVDVNLYGVIHGVQAAYPIMLRQRFGHIVNTASMAAFVPMAEAIPYTTTKNAVYGLSRSLRVAARREGIRVSVVCPGAVRTPILTVGKLCIDRTGFSMQQHQEYWEKYKPMDPDEFALQVLQAVARNKFLIIVPSWWKRFLWLDRLFPNFLIQLSQKDYEEQLEIARQKR